MLLALVFCHLSVLVVANPFHKYPYVFLLDVGNEELEKANTEQIRLSVPGGSVALRYPAIGDGDTLGHVRVSGIDFGTDLKANIVDGGPGYKYVVLVFMGNPGVAYDAVITVQTVNDTPLNTPYSDNVSNIGGNLEPDNGDDPYQVPNDLNNSAEDLSDNPQGSYSGSASQVEDNNSEVMQSSSNVYKYAQHEETDDADDFDEDDDIPEKNNDNSSDDLDFEDQGNEESESDVQKINYGSDGVSQKDIHLQYNQANEQIYDSSPQENNLEVNNDEDDDDDDVNKDDWIHSQVLRQRSRPDYKEVPLDYDQDSEGQYNEKDDEKFRDSNNNYIDIGDGYAVEYKK